MKAVCYGVISHPEINDLSKYLSETNNIAHGHPELLKRIEYLFIKKRIGNIHYPYFGYKQK